ncbi:MAG: AIR synthase-related protein, partial [Methylocella sp.]
ICGREDGAPPPVDLAAERRNGDFVRRLIESRAVTAVHDVSDGGLAVALADMAMAGGIGVSIEVSPPLPELGFLFGEDQARYIVATVPENAEAIRDRAETAGVVCEIIGVTGQGTLTLGSGAAILLNELVRVHEGWLPGYMDGADP